MMSRGDVSAAALSLVTTALMVAGYQRVLQRRRTRRGAGSAADRCNWLARLAIMVSAAPTGAGAGRRRRGVTQRAAARRPRGVGRPRPDDRRQAADGRLPAERPQVRILPRGSHLTSADARPCKVRATRANRGARQVAVINKRGTPQPCLPHPRSAPILSLRRCGCSPATSAP